MKRFYLKFKGGFKSRSLGYCVKPEGGILIRLPCRRVCTLNSVHMMSLKGVHLTSHKSMRLVILGQKPLVFKEQKKKVDRKPASKSSARKGKKEKKCGKQTPSGPKCQGQKQTEVKRTLSKGDNVSERRAMTRLDEYVIDPDSDQLVRRCQEVAPCGSQCENAAGHEDDHFFIDPGS